MISNSKYSAYRCFMAMMLAITVDLHPAICTDQERGRSRTLSDSLVYRAEDSTALHNPNRLRFSHRSPAIPTLDKDQLISVRPFASRYKALTDDALAISLSDAEKLGAYGLWISSIDGNCPELRIGGKSLPLLSELMLQSLTIELDGFGTTKPIDCNSAADIDCSSVLSAISRMPNLNALGIEGATLRPEHIRRIGQINGLRHLQLDRSSFSVRDESFTTILPKIHTLSLRFTSVSDDDLKIVITAPLLEDIDISGTEVTANGLRDLWQMPKLKRLHCQDLQFENDSLAGVTATSSLVGLHLGPASDYEAYLIMRALDDNPESEERPHFPVSDKQFLSLVEQCKLASLSLCCAEISDSVAQQVVLQHPLVELSVAGCESVGDKCASAIATSRLVRLDMSGTSMTNAGVRDIAKCNTLRHLSLSGTKVTSEAIRLLEGSQLVSINLDFTEIDDSVFKSLSKITTLESISLRSTKVTGLGIANLTACGKMTSVYLDFTEIGDSALFELKASSRLSEIGIVNCNKTTVNGILEFSKHPALHFIMVGPRDGVTMDTRMQMSHEGRIAIQ